MIKAILAIDDSGAIGLNGKLPWPNIPIDLQNFQKLTTNHHVVMGRKTWESLPEKYRPLPNRINYVVTQSKIEDINCISLGESIEFIHRLNEDTLQDVWIIGGGNLIEHMINEIQEFFITRVKATYTADTYIDINNLLKNFNKISKNRCEGLPGITIVFEKWQLNLLQ